MISYAQNFEDVLLWRCLKDVARGTYVDIGAHHPQLDSVTAWFYGQGWSGINVEPVPSLLALFEDARPRDHNLALAAGAEAGEAELHTFPNSLGLSTLNPEVAAASARESETIVVPVRPLRDILAPLAGQPIHFLKIDVEGAERDVLAGMDFAAYRPWMVVIEAAPPNNEGPTGPPWDDLIAPFGYREAWWDGLNRYYVADEHAELAPRLALSPNVFDQFELAAVVREREARIASETTQSELREAVSVRDRRVAELSAEQQEANRQHGARLAEFEAALAEQRSHLESSERALARQIADAEAVVREHAAVLSGYQEELRVSSELLGLSEEEAWRWRRAAEMAALHLDEANRALALAKARVDGLERSASWRLTAPVRWGTTTLRRAAGRTRHPMGGSAT